MSARFPIGQTWTDKTAAQAVDWLVCMQAGPWGPDERQAWMDWRRADAAHERAWQHLERAQSRVRGQLAGLSGQAAAQALIRPGRRRAIKALGVALAAGGLAAAVPPWLRQGGLAQVSTATGARRHLLLDDRSQLALNTDTAVDVRYGAAQRLVHLFRGELLARVSADEHAPPRPFVIQTGAGSVSLGAGRILLRSLPDGACRVALFEGEAVLRERSGAHHVIAGGQAMRLMAGGEPARPEPFEPQAAAWLSGRMVVSDMPLPRMLEELGRYRAGFVLCDDAAAGLRVSGVFSIDDTDRALQALAELLPVRIQRYSRYVVRVASA